MNFAAAAFDTLPTLPRWITSVRPETIEDVAFLSGTALAHLHGVLAEQAVPQAVLRDRLALHAAERCMILTGRSERAGKLRDAVAFTQPGDSPGPAGEVCRSWQQAARRPISSKALANALPGVTSDQIVGWLEAGEGAPVERAAKVLQAVLADRLRDPALALILADAALAKALGWTHLMPLLGLTFRRTDLRKEGDDLRYACHAAIKDAVVSAVREAARLASKAALLQEVSPKLRAKGADKAVAVFMSRDAVPATALTSLRSDRAARRFCDRLVELGAVKELTGRDTFRLYGLGT